MKSFSVLEGQAAMHLTDGWILADQRMGQYVFSGRFEDLPELTQPATYPFPLLGKIDGFIFDTPSIDDSMTVRDFYHWTSSLFDRIDQLSHRNAALILLPTNRRGGSFFKSSIIETVAQFHDWKACREFIWDQGSDFLLRKYPYRKFTVFRRGEKPMQDTSVLRYVDIIRHRPEKQKEEHDYASVPEDILADLLTLFKFSLVCDPFAGTGSLSKAAFLQGIPCISCEIDHDAAMRIVDTAIERTSKR